MIDDRVIDRARAVPIEVEIERRGIKLRRAGRELTGPCPRCGGTDRFSIHVVKQCWNCRGCKSVDITGDVIGLTQWLDGCTFEQAVETLTGEGRPPLRPVDQAKRRADDKRQHDKAAWLWRQRKPIAGTVAETYLRSRGITCPLPSSLGFLPATGNYPPSMIAAFAPNGAVDTVHITRLLPDGSDRERADKGKIMIGTHIGRPIVLAPITDLLGLAITEGIEDGLSAFQATGLGAWAAGSASTMRHLAEAVPDYVTSVSIFVDDDPDGRRYSAELAEALRVRAPRTIESHIKGKLRSERPIEVILRELSA
jgi:phage/plasmid primase-like uncharacterized protein